MLTKIWKTSQLALVRIQYVLYDLYSSRMVTITNNSQKQMTHPGALYNQT